LRAIPVHLRPVQLSDLARHLLESSVGKRLWLEFRVCRLNY
jgi:hypothetical protein